MECCTYLRNVTDLLSDGKTPYERRFGEPFKGTFVPFVSLVELLLYFCERPVKNPSICKESLTWIVPRIHCTRGWLWNGDILVADIEELETMDASEIYSKRLNAKEVIFHKENGKFIFPVADGRTKFVGGVQELRTSTLTRERPIRGECHVDFRGESEGSLFSNTSRLISGCGWSDEWFLVHVRKLHTAITLNRESSVTRREKNHFLFHWNALTYPELLIQTWMLCKNAASTITGISMDQEICLILGQVSLSLFYWKRNLQTDICGPGWDWQESR